LKIGPALCGLAIVLGLAACGPSAAEQDRKRARLDRELRQAKAEERRAIAAPLEVRTERFDAAIAEAEASHKRIQEQEEQLKAAKRAGKAE
jgi:hypothetical protein